MVCRTPGSFEVSPLSMSRDNIDLDLRDLNEFYEAPALRLVTVDDDLEAQVELAPSYEVWQQLSRDAREQRVAAAQQRRLLVRRKQGKRVEKFVFRSAAAIACITAITGAVHLISQSNAAPRNVVTVTVAPGDTLWTVASRYTPAGTPTIDTVGFIRSANPLLVKQSQLRIGERIQVPTRRG